MDKPPPAEAAAAARDAERRFAASRDEAEHQAEPEPLEARAATQAARYAAVHRTDAERAIASTLQLRNRLAHTYGVDLSVAQLLRAMQATGTILEADTTHRAARALEVIANTALGPR